MSYAITSCIIIKLLRYLLIACRSALTHCNPMFFVFAVASHLKTPHGVLNGINPRK